MWLLRRTQQKSTAIWRKFAAISNFSKIPLLYRYFWSFGIDLRQIFALIQQF
jgi:hypothetical protein